MDPVEVTPTLATDDAEAVAALTEAATAADGRRPLGEHTWLGAPGGALLANLVVRDPSSGRPKGYGQLTSKASSYALELVLAQQGGDVDLPVGRQLVEAAVRVTGEDGGGRLHLWVPDPTADHDRMAAAARLRHDRDLYQMRRPLPGPQVPAVETRPFEPGQDEQAVLRVNNRAFAGHSEQGGWELRTLERLQAEPWFDPTGLLLHERGRRLAGFCWTKVHGERRPAVGELYVVAVDPDFQGQGLGRGLVLAGLERLALQGLGTAMLYVDASNRRAVGLYEDLGFTVDHTDRSYVTEVRPAS